MSLQQFIIVMQHNDQNCIFSLGQTSVLSLPSEKKCEQWSCQVKPFIAIVISIIQFSSTKCCYQQSVHHVTVQKKTNHKT